MITLLQRVSEARVDVAATTIAEIGQGILVLVGVQADDDESRARYFVDRMLNYRVFADSDGKMNLSLMDIGGELAATVPFLDMHFRRDAAFWTAIDDWESNGGHKRP